MQSIGSIVRWSRARKRSFGEANLARPTSSTTPHSAGRFYFQIPGLPWNHANGAANPEIELVLKTSKSALNQIHWWYWLVRKSHYSAYLMPQNWWDWFENQRCSNTYSKVQSPTGLACTESSG